MYIYMISHSSVALFLPIILQRYSKYSVSCKIACKIVHNVNQITQKYTIVRANSKPKCFYGADALLRERLAKPPPDTLQ